MTRTDLSKATLQIMKTIQNGEIYTLNKISEKTELNFRTVQKALALIEACQKQLESKKINITHTDHATHIQMKAKSGITSMPLNIQKMLMRTSYYPTPDLWVDRTACSNIAVSTGWLIARDRDTTDAFNDIEWVESVICTLHVRKFTLIYFLIFYQ